MKAIIVSNTGSKLSNALFSDNFDTLGYKNKNDKEEGIADGNTLNELSTLDVTPQKGFVRFSKFGTSSAPSFVEGSEMETWTLYTHGFSAGCVPISLFYKGNGAMIHFLCNDWQDDKIKLFASWKGLKTAQSDLDNFYAVAAWSQGAYSSTQAFVQEAQGFEDTVNKHLKVKKDNVLAIHVHQPPENLVVCSNGVFGCASANNFKAIMKSKPDKKNGCQIL